MTVFPAGFFHPGRQVLVVERRVRLIAWGLFSGRAFLMEQFDGYVETIAGVYESYSSSIWY